MKTSPLQLNLTQVGEISLQPQSSEDFSATVNVTTTHEFRRGNENPKVWRLNMRVIFKGADGKPAQYEGFIDVMGVFTVLAEMPEEQMLRLVAVTCPSILYTTAREVIAGLTARGPHPTFYLPSVSFADQTLQPPEGSAASAPPLERTTPAQR